MQLKLVRSGGLAGLDMVSTVDTVDLSMDQQDVVSSLLTADLGDQGGRRSGGADQFSYQLEIHHGDRTVLCQWAEPEVPETVRSLLVTLTRQAKPAR